MYRRRLLVASLPLLFFLGGCPRMEFGDPAALRVQVQTALQPYFTNVQVVVDSQNSVIVGMTCTNDLGPQMLAAIQDQVLNLPDLRKLHSLRTWGPLVGSSTYKYFAIGFEKQVIRLDVDTWQVEIIEPGEQYEQGYREACGTARSPAYAYVGTWDVNYQQANGQTHSAQVVDSLGVYTPEDFPEYKIVEIASREAILRRALADEGFTGISLQLAKIQRVEITQKSLLDQ